MTSRTPRQQVFAILDKTPKGEQVDVILSASEEVLRYVVSIGLDRLRAMERFVRRSERKRPYVAVVKSGQTHGSIILTEAAKRKLNKISQTFLSKWKIGENTTLADATKVQLLTEAVAERRKGTGHIFTAEFYESLAQKMTDGQTVAEVWSNKQAQELRDDVWGEAA